MFVQRSVETERTVERMCGGVGGAGKTEMKEMRRDEKYVFAHIIFGFPVLAKKKSTSKISIFWVAGLHDRTSHRDSF